MVNSVVVETLDLPDLLDPIVRSSGDVLRKTTEMTIFIFITLSLSVAHVSSYAQIDNGDYTALYVILQLVLASLVIYLLDKILSYCQIHPSLTLFVLKNSCTTVLKQALSASTFDYGQGPQVEGSLVFLLQSLSTFKSKSLALYQAFFRKGQPNLSSLCSSVAVFLTLMFLQEVRVELPVKSKQRFGLHGTFPIKLLYTSHNSFMFQVLAGMSTDLLI